MCPCAAAARARRRTGPAARPAAPSATRAGCAQRMRCTHMMRLPQERVQPAVVVAPGLREAQHDVPLRLREALAPCLPSISPVPSPLTTHAHVPALAHTTAITACGAASSASSSACSPRASATRRAAAGSGSARASASAARACKPGWSSCGARGARVGSRCSSLPRQQPSCVGADARTHAMQCIRVARSFFTRHSACASSSSWRPVSPRGPGSRRRTHAARLGVLLALEVHPGEVQQRVLPVAPASHERQDARAARARTTRARRGSAARSTRAGCLRR
jgi:hypothetical protein